MKNAEKSGFTEHFIRANGLGKNDFEEWLLCSGMLFKAPNTWWGIQGKRKKLHEGLDLGFYRNQKKEIIGFNDSTKIPTIYDGVIVGIFNDFLGKSIFVKHEISSADDGTLFTIFGHVNPEKEIYPGMRLEEGEIIASVATEAQGPYRPAASSHPTGRSGPLAHALPPLAWPFRVRKDLTHSRSQSAPE